MSLLRGGGDIIALAIALLWRGATAALHGDHDRAEQALDEALGLASTIHDPELAAAMSARAMSNLGIAAHAHGDFDTAVHRHEMALRTCREHGYLLGAVRALRDLGDVARDWGDSMASLAYYRECLSSLGEQGDLRVVIDALVGAALAAVAWGQSQR
ncbi:MAG: tetratricopeptide repeat protein, partial [Chloroflexota bacterium]|nr:tetratricopeptide repeat protein [Chloroflexota bacterium]